MKSLLACLLVLHAAVGCQTPPDRQADGPPPTVLLKNSGAPLPAPRAGYVPENLPPQLLGEIRKRLADTTPAGEQRWQTLQACLTLQQKQAMVWHMKIVQAPPDPVEQSRALFSLAESLGADVAEVLVAALHHKDGAVRRRACELAGSIGFGQQGPDRLDPKFAALINALVATALPGEPEEDRLAALEALDQFHDHPTPWAHQLAGLLNDDSHAVRRQVAGVLSQCGPSAAPYMKTIMEEFNISGSREDAEKAAWIMHEAGWGPAEAGPLLVRQIGKVSEDRSGSDVPPLTYAIPYVPASEAMADALLALPPAHLCHWEICHWIKSHAAGDRRFIAPLLAALEKDWICESYEKSATCFDSDRLTKALVALGRGDAPLVATLTARLQRPIPADARLYVGRTLSQLTGEPRHLVEALEWMLEHHQERAATYTEDRVVELLADVDPSLAPRLDPYRARLVDIVNSMGQGDPTGYFILTGDMDPVMAWARRDLQNTYKNNLCSSVMEDVADTFGPLLEPLVGQLTGLIRESDDYDQHGVCAALVPLGPDPAAEGLTAEMLALAGRFCPRQQVEPALALWSGSRNTRAALSILLPLLDDRGWATTRASWALGQMGRDAAPALGRLRQIARGPNPAYAKSASEAIKLIETELSRQVTFEQMWKELGSDDPLESIRALWRMVDVGESVVVDIEKRKAQDSPAQLPGRRIRHLARAQQVLRILARVSK